MLKTSIHNCLGKQYAVLDNDRSFEAQYIREGREWEKEQMDAFLGSFDAKGGVIIDGGAGYGSNTLRFADAVGSSGTVYAIELQRVIFQALCGNVFLNGYENVVAIQAALHEEYFCSDKGMVLAWSDSDTDTGGVRSLKNTGRYDVYKNLSPTETIDHFYSHDVRGIKLDIEGDEFFALKGAEKTIERCRPVIFCELSAHYLKTHNQTIQETIDWVERKGYRTEVLNEFENAKEVLFLP